MELTVIPESTLLFTLDVPVYVVAHAGQQRINGLHGNLNHWIGGGFCNREMKLIVQICLLLRIIGIAPVKLHEVFL